MSKPKVDEQQELVWAFKGLKELDDKTGFVECDSSLAKKLIKSGDVQDPRVGGRDLKYIEEKEVKAKVTKELKAKTTKKAK